MVVDAVLSLLIIWGCGYSSHLFFEIIVGHDTKEVACEAEQKGIKQGDNSFADAIFWSDLGNH